MRDTTRLMVAIVGLQITLFGTMLALVATGGLQSFGPPEAGVLVAAAGFVLSVPALLVAGPREPRDR